MAYKAFRGARGIPQGRDALRMMQRMGMKVEELPDVQEVLIRTNSKEILISEPLVSAITVQGQKMYQISGGTVSEKAPTKEVTPQILEDDVKLVAEQTGRSIEEARKALEEAGGDLAKAIIALKHS